ncbi:MAG: hypothetical protein EOP88_17745 [Verrucomicrobiaceae bacterium]|nr:MAG: hypothetical protein EOP88_17745 [Verrucomicrobiaceae bacterium]
MRSFLILLLAAATAFAEPETGEGDAGEKLVRTGAPKECYLQAWGKGPDWLAKVAVEFKLGHLSRKRPTVVDMYSEPTGKALGWLAVEGGPEPKVTTVAEVLGREVVEIVCPGDQSSRREIDTVMLAIETARDSEWFSPFFCGSPDHFRSRFVSGEDVTAGYVATLEWSGTGGHRTHHLFDLRKPNPVMVARLEVGRVVRKPGQSDAEFEKANKVFEHEASVLTGNLPGK